MGKKKIIVSLVACALIIGTFVFVNQGEKNTDTLEFNVATLDVATTDGSEITLEDTQIVEIIDDETPLAVIGGSGNSSTRNLNSSELNAIKDELVQLVNSERNKKVKEYSKLETTGNIRAKEAAVVFSHTRPNGKDWSTVLAANGISSSNLKAGEDLAKITSNAKASYSEEFLEKLSDTIHQNLMNSETHRKVILNENYEEIGIGVYSQVEDGKLTIYITEHFKNETVETTPVSSLTIKGVPTTSVYTGKQIKPSITVYNGNTKLSTSNYSVTYGTNKSTGKATVTVTGKGSYSGKVTKTFYIVPKKVTLSSVTAGSKKATVKVAKATGASGYQIAYKKSGSSKWSYKTTTAVSKTITGLTKGKNYTFKVRAYKTVNGKKYYGTYSSSKTVKIK